MGGTVETAYQLCNISTRNTNSRGTSKWRSSVSSTVQVLVRTETEQVKEVPYIRCIDMRLFVNMALL